LAGVSVGALVVASIATLLAWFGFATDLLVPTAYTTMLIGLLAAVPAAVTGLADLLDLPVDAPARTTALIHLTLMGTAIAVFLLTVLLLHPGVEHRQVPGAAAVTAAAGFVVLAAGGWVGGSLAYGHGVRVAGKPDTPTREVLRPRRSEPPSDGWTPPLP
jgi:uncharacterized membrane protein